MDDIRVEVQPDHLERLARTRPITALAELVWNGLDADATEVMIDVEQSALGACESITVSDDGHGIAPDEVRDAFGRLGGSWKSKDRHTRMDGRILHGKNGEGRFKAYALGQSVVWDSVARDDSGLVRTTVSATASELGRFHVTDPHHVDADRASGTVVVVNDISERVPDITPAVLDELTAEFALYLTKYPGVAIMVNGVPLDPASQIADVADYDLPTVDVDGTPVTGIGLSIVEWNRPFPRSLFLCDVHGFTLQRVAVGIHAKGFDYTAYLKSDAIRDLHADGFLELGELHPGLSSLLEAAKERIRTHFQERALEEARAEVQSWKDEQIYPFEGEPVSPIERVEREVFDVVALSVTQNVPRFRETDLVSRKLSFRLLKQAIEENPAALRRILRDVLDLPRDQQDDLARLLERTSLTALIEASREAANRLDFLHGLEILLFRPDTRDQLLERKQLHRILAAQTWVFGEEFHLSNDDESLSKVLAKHLELLRAESRESTADNVPNEELPEVLRADGSRGIVDLMLSRRIPQPQKKRRSHLVVELKRPSQAINAKIVEQVKSYVYAVARDERFKHSSTDWSFWAISNRVTDQVMFEMEDSEAGILKTYENPRIVIYVRTWGQVIDEARARLTFFQDRLKYIPDDASALDYLQRTHAKYLPPSARESAAGDRGAAG